VRNSSDEKRILLCFSLEKLANNARSNNSQISSAFRSHQAARCVLFEAQRIEAFSMPDCSVVPKRIRNGWWDDT
jgi:hypothetical protein